MKKELPYVVNGKNEIAVYIVPCTVGAWEVLAIVQCCCPSFLIFTSSTHHHLLWLEITKVVEYKFITGVTLLTVTRDVTTGKI